MPIVHHIEGSHIEKHSVAICGYTGWVAATTGWAEVTCPSCLESRPTPDAADTPKARVIRSGMPKGYKFPKKKCPRCLAEVAENRYVQHIRSKCVLR